MSVIYSIQPTNSGGKPLGCFDNFQPNFFLNDKCHSSWRKCYIVMNYKKTRELLGDGKLVRDIWFPMFSSDLRAF